MKAGVLSRPTGSWPYPTISGADLQAQTHDGGVVENNNWNYCDYYNGYAWILYLGPRYPGEGDNGNYRGPNNAFDFN